MPKKCIICNKTAEFCIKDSSECYCSECAKEQFSDISYLVNVEEQAKTQDQRSARRSEAPCEVKKLVEEQLD